MNTIERLVKLGNSMGLETWWYPLWQKMLEPYTLVGYATQNLSVGSQSALFNPLPNAPYNYPDFTVFQTTVTVNNDVERTLFLMLEAKRYATPGGLFEGVVKMEHYLDWATDDQNKPHNIVYGVVCAGSQWMWKTISYNPGAAQWQKSNWSIPVEATLGHPFGNDINL